MIEKKEQLVINIKKDFLGIKGYTTKRDFKKQILALKEQFTKLT